MPDRWQEFMVAFKKSITAIEDRYFQIDRAKSPAAWRERAYCYELYHQLRNKLPEDFPYTLHGEIDKRGHQYICTHFVKCPNPDFIIHEPGTMNNLVVIEIKQCGCNLDEAKEDIQKIKTFVEQVGYQHGIFLIYGDRAIDNLDVPYEKISVLWHKGVGQQLELIAGEQGWRND